MTLAPQVAKESPVRTLEFRRLDGSVSPTEQIVTNLGVVYVSSITRDGCSGCMEQKPLFHQLANKMTEQYNDKVGFTNIHITYDDSNMAESADAKRAFGHGAYPTYMIQVKSRYGPLELYRAVYPSMEELEKQINAAFELAEYYQADAEKN